MAKIWLKKDIKNKEVAAIIKPQKKGLKTAQKTCRGMGFTPQNGVSLLLKSE